MIPYRQGQLDGLCGVYSIINSARIINNFDHKYCESIFREIVKFLALEYSFSKIMTQGVNVKIIGRIIDDVEKLNLVKQKLPRDEKKLPLTLFWSSMQRHLAEPNRAILLGLGGVYNHWTVSHKISDRRMMLFDSAHLQHLNKYSCTTQRLNENYRHIIKPKYTYYLRSRGV